MHVKLKVFKKDDNKEFRLLQNSTKGETDFNHFLRLINQLIIAAENSAKDENLYPVLIPRVSKGIDKQLILFHRVVEVVYRAKGKIRLTLLRYSVDKPESSYRQVFAGKTEDGKFQQIV